MGTVFIQHSHVAACQAGGAQLMLGSHGRHGSGVLPFARHYDRKAPEKQYLQA